MSRIRWQEHIVMDRDLHHGDPCIEGTRIPVATIVGSLADGMTYGQIRQAYLQIRDDHIVAALCVGMTGPVPDERTCGREPGSQGTPALNLSSG